MNVQNVFNWPIMSKGIESIVNGVPQKNTSESFHLTADLHTFK